MTIRDIVLMPLGSSIDFLGVLMRTGKCFDTDKSSRLNIQLGDNSLNQLNCTIWNSDIIKDLENKVLNRNWTFSQYDPVILAFKGVRISEHGTRSLNVNQ
jgi:hypothetical protein